MKDQTAPFPNLIGQTQIKHTLKFYADARNSGSIIRPIIFNGARGLGKTRFAREFVKELSQPLVEINCGSIKSAQQFFEQIFLDHIQYKNVSVFFDEFHALPSSLVDVFLTAFNTDGKQKRDVAFGEEANGEIDFAMQSFLFATTELHQVFDPLKDRMTTIDFKPYSSSELSEIIRKKFDWIQYEDGLLDDISNSISGNARSAVKRAQDIESYCQVKNIHTMTHDHWENMKKILNILPFGLKNIEVEILQILKKNGPSSLQTLSAITGMSRSAIQKEAENNLLRCGFLEIDGKRKITHKGLQVINQINQ